MARDLSFLIPEILLLITIVVALIAEMFRLYRTTLIICVCGLLIATGASFQLLGLETTVFGGTFRIDSLSVWGKIILLPATILSLLLVRAEFSGKEGNNTDREGTVYVLICLTSLASILLAGVGDSMLLVLGILLSGLASFALVAFHRTKLATEAAMKFFVFASVTTSVMIFCLSYWFGGTGSTLLSELASLEKTPLIAVIGLMGIIVGLGYKASLVPFHFWAPDAYQGAPIGIAAYLSVVPKIGAILAFAQVVRDLPMNTEWPFILAVIAALSMTYGYLAALMQKNVVRLLAYSSIAQAGYFLMGVVAVGSSSLALSSLVIFSAAYAAMNLGAFAIVVRTGRCIDDFVGMGRNNLLAGFAMVLFLLSLAGIPPLAGFVGKFLLFGATIEAGFSWLAVIAIINSVLSLVVYLRILVPMYRTSNEPVEKSISETSAVPQVATLSKNSKPALSSQIHSSAKLYTPSFLLESVWVIALILTISVGLGAQLLLEQM